MRFSLKVFRNAVVCAALSGLLGCAEYEPYRYVDRDYSDARYRGDGDYYYERDAYAEYGYAPQFLYWPEYYSVLYPVYHHYYDPWYCPGFYYGVTYFPSTWFGIGLHSRYAWPYYTAYSPYRYAAWDNYYAWYGGSHRRHHHARDDGPRFGSAANEAERLARIGPPPAARPRTEDQAYRQRGYYADGYRERGAADSRSPRPYGRPNEDARIDRAGAAASELGRLSSSAERSRPAAYGPADTRGDPRAAPASRGGYDARDRGAARYEPRSGWIGPAPGSRSARDDRADAPLEPERSFEVDARPRAGAWTPSRTEARSTGPREDPGPRYRAVESRAGYAEPGVPAPSEPRYFAPAPRERYAAPSLGGSNREVQRLSGAGNMGSAPPPRYEAAAPRYESPPPRSEAPSHSTAPARESDDSTRREGSRERDR